MKKRAEGTPFLTRVKAINEGIYVRDTLKGELVKQPVITNSYALNCFSENPDVRSACSDA